MKTRNIGLLELYLDILILDNLYLGISVLIDTNFLLFGLPREGLATEEESSTPAASVK